MFLNHYYYYDYNYYFHYYQFNGSKTMTFASIQSAVIYAHHLEPTAISCSIGSVTDLGFMLSSDASPHRTYLM